MVNGESVAAGGLDDKEQGMGFRGDTVMENRKHCAEAWPSPE